MPLFWVEYIAGDAILKDVITADTPAGAAATIREWMPTAHICDVQEANQDVNWI